VEGGVRASRALRLTYALLLPLTIFTTTIPWLYLALTTPLEGLLELFESSIPYFATLVFTLNISKLLAARLYGALRFKELKTVGIGEELYGIVEELRRRVGCGGEGRGRISVRVVNCELGTVAFTPSGIIATKGLLNALDKSEVEAVLAHELGHAKRALNILALEVLSTLALMNLAALMEAIAFSRGGLVVIALFTTTLPISALGVLSLKRLEEHLADEISVKATKSIALVKALEKLEGQKPELKRPVGVRKLILLLAPLLFLGALLLLLPQPSMKAQELVIKHCYEELERSLGEGFEGCGINGRC
jgi:Zn-dependent protease with chaperone function